jgi:hypothetical protein
MLKLKMIAFLILTVFCTAGFSDEGEPISLFQIDFDLTADSAFELAAARFKCASEYGGWHKGQNNCELNDTKMVIVNSRGNDLAKVTFTCSTFNGCGYSADELKKSLSKTKLLVFEGDCAAGGLGEEVCVSGNYVDLRITMNRAKFRAKTLSFD